MNSFVPFLIAVPLFGVATTARSAEAAEAAAGQLAPPARARTGLGLAQSGLETPGPAENNVGGVGGPLDDSSIGPADPIIDEDWQRWIGAPDPDLERRYAPEPRQPLGAPNPAFERRYAPWPLQPLNSATIRF